MVILKKLIGDAWRNWWDAESNFPHCFFVAL